MVLASSIHAIDVSAQLDIIQLDMQQKPLYLQHLKSKASFFIPQNIDETVIRHSV